MNDIFKNENSVDIKHSLIAQILSICICIISCAILLINQNSNYSLVVIFVGIIETILLGIIGVYNFINALNKQKLENELKNTIEHNNALSKIIDGIRGFKHDMGNIIQSILGYTTLNDIEGAKKYCQNLAISFNDVNMLSVLSPKVINEPAIYGIVTAKMLKAKECNIKFELEITSDISKINFPKFELSRIFGILLDNAIEASIKTYDKHLTLKVYYNKEKRTDEIIISNSIIDTNIPLSKIFDKGYSTKKTPSGLGLYEVKEILSRFKQSNMETIIDCDNKLFIQKISISSL